MFAGTRKQETNGAAHCLGWKLEQSSTTPTPQHPLPFVALNKCQWSDIHPSIAESSKAHFLLEIKSTCNTDKHTCCTIILNCWVQFFFFCVVYNITCLGPKYPSKVKIFIYHLCRTIFGYVCWLMEGKKKRGKKITHWWHV